MYESPERIGLVDQTPETIRKVSIIISRGLYPGLIMTNGARMEGIEANLFFTFFGLDAIQKKRQEHIRIATVGNPGLHLMTWLGGVPGMSALVTRFMSKLMEKLDIPPIPELIQMIADSGAHLHGCKASVEMFGLDGSDFVPQVNGIVTVGEFYEMAGGGEIIFT
jgi:peroxiredoxin family protein